MIEIIQAGQAGKTESLIEMHRVRKFIFKDRMKWDVDISGEGLEIDDYDLPETVYILARDEKKRVSGVWRMLPSTSPSMIRDIWPEFLEGFDMPRKPCVWEVSRFGVYSYSNDTRSTVKSNRNITALLINGLVTVCNMVGIQDIFTMYEPKVGRAVSRTGFVASDYSQELPVEGSASIVGRFRTDNAMLKNVRRKTGVSYTPTYDDLPPLLQRKMSQILSPKERENINA